MRALDGYLPAPTEMATALGRVLDDTALPEIFVGFEPIPARPSTCPTTQS